jgi:hypothetical protein
MFVLFFVIVFIAELIVASKIIQIIKKADAKICTVNEQILSARPQIKKGITSVSWNFTLFPSQTFKDNFGASLLRYAQGSKDWAEVKAGVVSDWASESAM